MSKSFCESQASSGDEQDNSTINHPKPMDSWRSIPIGSRMLIGMKCKRLIEEARLHGLHRRGYCAKLVEYIQSGVSPENKLLIVSPVGGINDNDR